MTVDANAGGGWIAAEGDLGQKRSVPRYQTRDSFFTEVVKIGRYDLIYRIGSGGMATVFVARLSGLAGFERLVAVKVIHQHLADSRKFVQMFLDEARMAASIHHPNVVETYEVGRDDGLFYIVGEFVPGQDLNRLLRRAEERGTPLSQGLIAKIAAQICFGLHAAHETRDQDGHPLNLIHRDVSPNNILISYDGFVKLIDFGVAWARNKMAQTESGALKGKIGYISPEQITGQPLDRRSDIFSAGVLAYTMATLTHPFPGDSDAERLNKIITGDVLPPHEMVPDIEPEFERIILKAMSNAPDDRHATAAEMGRELEAFAESTGDEIKPDAISGILRDFFEEEQKIHESRIAAYRAAIEQEKSQGGGLPEDDLFLSDTASYTAQRRSPYRGGSRLARMGRNRRRLLLSFVAAALIGISALLIWMVNLTTMDVADKGSGVPRTGKMVPAEQTASEDVTGGAGLVTDASAGSAPVEATAQERGNQAAPVVVEQPLELSAPDSEVPISPEIPAEELKQGERMQPDQPAYPKKRKPKKPKQQSELLTSPYS